MKNKIHPIILWDNWFHMHSYSKRWLRILDLLSRHVLTSEQHQRSKHYRNVNPLGHLSTKKVQIFQNLDMNLSWKYTWSYLIRYGSLSDCTLRGLLTFVSYDRLAGGSRALKPYNYIVKEGLQISLRHTLF